VSMPGGGSATIKNHAAFIWSVADLLRGDYKPTGLQITDSLLWELADLRTTNGAILPFPQLSVRQVTLDGIAVAVLVVEPSTSPPVRFKGRTWIRVGPARVRPPSRRRRCSPSAGKAANLPFDARPLPSATLDDLDLDLDRFSDEILP
jgi:ATP-dependent DNA helicase RecG